MASQWYYKKGPIEFGPLSSQEIRHRAKSGEIQPADLLRQTGMEKWVPAQKIKGLFTSQQGTVAVPKPVPSASPSPSATPGMASAVNPETSHFACPHCQQIMQVQEEFKGQQVKCPHCSQVVMIGATTTSSQPRPLPQEAPTLPTAIPDLPRVNPQPQKSDPIVPPGPGDSVKVETVPTIVPQTAQAGQITIASQDRTRTRRSSSDAERLLGVRQEAYAELMDYQAIEYQDVQLRWKKTGFLGGHRKYLGQNVMAMLMALTMGGAFVWWLFDRTQLKKMTDAWNADQLKRQQTNKPPRDSEGLVLVDPVELQKPAPWKDKPPPIAEKIIMLIYTMPTQILQLPAKLFAKKKAQGRKPSAFQKMLKFFSEDFVSLYEVILLSLLMGFVAWLFADSIGIEIGLMLMIVTMTLAFPKLALARRKTTVGKAALKWDYLICSYYHQHRPSLFLVSYVVNLVGYVPRLFGWRKSETKLYLTLAGQAALFSVLTVPLDILSSMIREGSVDLLVELTIEPAVGLFVTVIFIPAYLPPLVEPLAQCKLTGKTTKLKFAGFLGCTCAFIGTLLGFFGIGF